MGLIVNIYRGNHRDCTNGGISSKVRGLCIVNIKGPFEPTELNPAALLVGHPTIKGIARIVPAVWIDVPGAWYELNGTMAGGNYAATSDSRFTGAVEAITGHPFYGAVSVHDRIE